MPAFRKCGGESNTLAVLMRFNEIRKFIMKGNNMQPGITTRFILFVLLIFIITPNLNAQDPNWFEHVTVSSWSIPHYSPTSGRLWAHNILQKPAMWEELTYWHDLRKYYFSSVTFANTADFEFADSVTCRDIDGNIILHQGDYKLPNLHHPAHRDSLISWAKQDIDFGVDGISVDGFFPNFWAIELHGGSFDQYTMEAFKEYLNAKYTSNDLATKFDISDISTFHFGDWIRQHGYEDNYRTYPFYSTFPLKSELASEFLLFEWQFATNFFIEYITTIKEYAMSKYNRHLYVSDNNAGTYYSVTKYEDFQLGEFFYHWPNNYLWQYAATQIKIGKSINNKPIVILPEVMEEYNVPIYTNNLVKLMLADIYASGGLSIVMNTWTGPPYTITYEINLDILSQYTSFILNNGYLFENLVPKSKVAVIYSQTCSFNQTIALENPSGELVGDSRGISKLLVDCNIQHDFVFLTDTRFTNTDYILNLSDLIQYECIIMPNIFSLTDQQLDVLLQYVSSGGVILALGVTGTHDEWGKLANRSEIETLTTAGVHPYGNGTFVYFNERLGRRYADMGDSADKYTIYDTLKKFIKPFTIVEPDNQAAVFIYDKENADSKIIHLVNYNYNHQTDEFQSLENINLKVLVDTSKVWEATCVSPDFSGKQLLETTIDSGYINISVPKLEAYDIITVQENLYAPQIAHRFPQNDTTIIAGDQIDFSVDVLDKDNNHLAYQWFINGVIDSTAITKTFSFNPEPNYSGIDTVEVLISDGSRNINSQWIVTTRKYSFPVVVFDETHSPFMSIDSSLALQLLINDEGPNYNIEHLNWHLCDILANRLSKKFIVDRKSGTPLVVDNRYENILIISPSQNDISLEEMNTIEYFVKNGGSVLILSLNWWGPGVSSNSNMVRLINKFGFQPSPYPLLIYDYYLEEYSPNFIVSLDGAHPAIPSCRIEYTSGHKIEAIADFAQIVETTGALDVFEDINKNRQKDSDEQFISDVGIIGVSEYEKGRVAYVSYSNVTNSVEVESNFDLISSIVDWLAYNVNADINNSEPKVISRFPQTDTTIIAGNDILFSVNVEDNDKTPLIYSWSVNNKIDSLNNKSEYLYSNPRDYSGVDTIQVKIFDGKFEIVSEWVVNNLPYKYPIVLFNEAHSPHFSPDSLRALQLLINDEGTNYNLNHIDSYWMSKLINKLQEDFIVQSDISAPLDLDNALQDVLFMVPCYQDISSQDRETIKTFIANGGGMLVLSTPFWGDAVNNTNSNTYKLFDEFGIKRGNKLLLASPNSPNDWDPTFYVELKGNHPAASASQIRCSLGHKLETTTDFAQIIETTGNLQVFEDANGNNTKDGNEPLQTDVGIIGVSEYGNGRVVYISWHMFANDSEYNPNFELVSDAMKWLSERVNQISTSIDNNISNIPSYFELKQNYPNPFNPTTKIEFSLPKTCNVEIKIYNMLGQEIKTLVNKNYKAGSHVVVWDGKDNFGKTVSTGLYLYSMKAGDFVKVKKGLLLK